MTEKSITRHLQTISMGCKVEKTHLKFLCPCWFIFASCGMLQKKGSKNGTLEGLESPEFALQFSWILAKFYTVLKDFHYNWSLIFNNEIDLIFTIFSVFEFQFQFQYNPGWYLVICTDDELCTPLSCFYLCSIVHTNQETRIINASYCKDKCDSLWIIW